VVATVLTDVSSVSGEVGRGKARTSTKLISLLVMWVQCSAVQECKLLEYQVRPHVEFKTATGTEICS